MKRNYAGCAICDSTWGDLWAEVEGETMFFCCEVCLAQFRRLLERIEKETGWTAVESIEIGGDRRGRTCLASAHGDVFRCRVAFNPQGEIRRFETLGASPRGAT